MSNERRVGPQEIHLNNDLPILFVDTCAVSHRADGFTYLSFATNTPNTPKGIVEQVRLIIDEKSLQLIIDALCRNIDYFPEKPSKKPRRSSK